METGDKDIPGPRGQIEARDMFQAKKNLLRYEKRPPDQLKMYPATANALTHETQLITAQAKKSTVNLASSNTNDFERNIA